MNIGTKIKAFRESKNISREQMSDWLTLSVNTYKKIEYGERNPTFEELEKIGEFLDIDPSSFFNNSGDTIIQSSSNNGMVGYSKVVMADRQFMVEVLGILKEISSLLSKVSDCIEKRKQ
jgi:transcriptional regulator with XRE-family HTH domain